MSSSSKMLAILGLFNRDRMAISADDVVNLLGYSHATSYRYMGELCKAGLLFPFSSKYILGAGVLELDNLIQATDPIWRASRPVAALLIAKFRCDVLITVLFGDRPVVLNHERGDGGATAGYERGHVLPLFRGATSKALIGSLPPAKQRRLLKTHGEDARSEGLPEDWASFAKVFFAHRRAGCVTCFDELEPGLVDVAVSIDLPAPVPPQSLALLFSKERYEVLNGGLVAQLLLDAAREIRGSIRLRNVPFDPSS